MTDEVANNSLKKANDALEQSFNDFLKENNQARRIPIVDSISAKYGNDEVMIPYANYFFGTEGKNIQNASQCTIARGASGESASFGKSILVEANTAFDIKSIDAQMEILNGDAKNCFSGNSASIGTFW